MLIKVPRHCLTTKTGLEVIVPKIVEVVFGNKLVMDILGIFIISSMYNLCVNMWDCELKETGHVRMNILPFYNYCHFYSEGIYVYLCTKGAGADEIS